MYSKHTSEPWEVVEYDPATVWVETKSRSPICQIAIRKADGETTANANLLAAVPAMDRALGTIEQEIENCLEQGDVLIPSEIAEGILQEVSQIVAAARRKAGGEKDTAMGRSNKNSA